MILVWVAILAVGLVFLIVMSRYRAQQGSDMGSVSQRWLAEHRLGRGGSA